MRTGRGTGSEDETVKTERGVGRRLRELDGADAAGHVVLVDLVLLQEDVQRLLVLRERMAGHSKIGRMSTFYKYGTSCGVLSFRRTLTRSES